MSCSYKYILCTYSRHNKIYIICIIMNKLCYMHPEYIIYYWYYYYPYLYICLFLSLNN